MWANRVIALPHGEWALAGIRFRDRNLERCFVDIIATSLPARPESLATLAPALEFFSEFSPKRLRIVIPDLDLFTASGDPAAPDTEPDLRVVAAALDEATPLSTGYVSLVSTNPDAASSLAEQMYGRIAADNPVLLEWSHLSTASCLSDPADEGLLFTIRFRDEDAGVLALLRQDDYGLAGWLVEEKCVDPAFRGAQPLSGGDRPRHAAAGVPSGLRRDQGRRHPARHLRPHPQGQRVLAAQCLRRRTPRRRRASLGHTGGLPRVLGAVVTDQGIRGYLYGPDVDSICYMTTTEAVIDQISARAQDADELRAHAAEMLVSAVRTGYAAGLTQRQIADAVGRSQPEVSRLLRFHSTTPLGQRLQRRRPRVLEILRKAGVTNPRVFGSVARGEDHEDSDIDLLVDLPEGFGLLSLSRLEGQVAEALGTRVDIVPASALRVNISRSALADAVPL